MGSKKEVPLLSHSRSLFHDVLELRTLVREWECFLLHFPLVPTKESMIFSRNWESEWTPTESMIGLRREERKLRITWRESRKWSRGNWMKNLPRKFRDIQFLLFCQSSLSSGEPWESRRVSTLLSAIREDALFSICVCLPLIIVVRAFLVWSLSVTAFRPLLSPMMVSSHKEKQLLLTTIFLPPSVLDSLRTLMLLERESISCSPLSCVTPLVLCLVSCVMCFSFTLSSFSFDVCVFPFSL